MPAEDLVDREGFLAELQQRLRDGHSVMLAAPRRTGKSSVATEALRRLGADGCYTARLDLFYVTEVGEFAAKLLHAVLENRTGITHTAVRAARDLRQWLAQGELHARIHDLEVGVTLQRSEQDPLRLLEDAVRTAERLAAADGRRFAVMLDEFQEVERLGGEPLLKRLRALFQEQRRVVYLFVGSQTTVMRTLFGDRRQAFYRFATLMPLPDIPAAAWKEYLRAKFDGLRLGVTAPALEAVLERTGNHPYCVMALAYNAVAQARTGARAEVTADTVAFAYERTLEQLGAVYELQWREVRRIRHADRVFTAVARGAAPYGLGLNPASVTRALRALEAASLLRRGSRRGEYVMVEPMFAEWSLRPR